MKIGDKVRFLNEVGGGVIAGFQGKDIVLVADADGFELPTLRKDVVVIETDEYNWEKKTLAPKRPAEEPKRPAAVSVRQALKVEDVADAEDDEPDTAFLDKEITFRPKAQERPGADALNFFLAFVPVDVKRLTDTAFEVYLVNDCNYHLHASLLSCEGAARRLRHVAELEPNTKFFIEEISRDRLASWERLAVQAIAYKRDKPFLPKQPVYVELRIDGTKFYKLHTFRPNDFFSEPALLYDIVRDDRPARPVVPDSQELRQTMLTPAPRPAASPARVAQPASPRAAGQQTDGVIEVDLHASSLLDTMVGLEPGDILDYQLKVFRDTMDAHLKERGRRIVFIHGKGDGVLRHAILRELRARYPRCRFQDAPFSRYGHGATMVVM